MSIQPQRKKKILGGEFSPSWEIALWTTGQFWLWLKQTYMHTMMNIRAVCCRKMNIYAAQYFFSPFINFIMLKFLSFFLTVVPWLRVNPQYYTNTFYGDGCICMKCTHPSRTQQGRPMWISFQYLLWCSKALAQKDIKRERTITDKTKNSFLKHLLTKLLCNCD